jgi:hypothetical protein
MAESRLGLPFALTLVWSSAVWGSAPLPPSGTIIFSDLCAAPAGGFSGGRLTLKRAASGAIGESSGQYQWGPDAARTAPLEQLSLAPDGGIAFRYMPDAENPEVTVQVRGKLTGDGFDGTADGKPLHIARAKDSRAAIAPCD